MSGKAKQDFADASLLELLKFHEENASIWKTLPSDLVDAFWERFNELMRKMAVVMKWDLDDLTEDHIEPLKGELAAVKDQVAALRDKVDEAAAELRQLSKRFERLLTALQNTEVSISVRDFVEVGR